jgi:hypothetical protein
MRAFAFALAAAAVCSAESARAQVNTEPLRKRIRQKGTSFILEGTFDGHTGNTQGVTADGLVGLGFATGRHLAFGFASADYSKLNGTLGVDKSFAHARYDCELLPWGWWELFAQAQSDHFQRIALRNIFGAGPRVALYEDKQIGLFLGVAYMFERDAYALAPGDPAPSIQTAHRVSAYLSARTTLADGIDAVTTTYLQPRIDDPSDLRVLSESGFVFKIARWLSTSIAFTAHYDSRVPIGVLRTDTELKNALALTL